MNILDQLRSDWHRTSDTKNAREALRRWALQAAALERFASPAELIRTILSSDYTTANRLTRCVVGHGRCRVAHATIVAAALPTFASELRVGLRQASRVQPGIDGDDLAASLLVALLAAIDRLLDDPAMPEWPLSRIHNALNLERRRYLRGLQRCQGWVSFDPLLHTQTMAVCDPAHQDSDLLMWTINEAVADGGLDPADATLIARRHVLGEPLTHSATDRSIRSRQRRRQQAEKTLIAHARRTNLAVA